MRPAKFQKRPEACMIYRDTVEAYRDPLGAWVIEGADSAPRVDNWLFRLVYVPAGEDHHILMEGGGTMSRNEAFREGLITPHGTIDDLSDPTLEGEG